MNFPLDYASLGLYVASFLGYGALLYFDRRWFGRLATLALAAGILVHYFALLERARVIHAVPYDDLYGSMSLFAWLLGLTYLGLETFHRDRSVGAFVMPWVIGWLIVAMAVAPPSQPKRLEASGVVFALHITANILAYSAFAISFVLSVIYLAQNRLLRQHRPGRVFWRFPALDVLERMSRSSVWVGLVSLAIGTVFGFVWQRRLSGGLRVGDPKVVATIAVLAVYAAYLRLMNVSAWRGARAALLCACNFLIVLFSYTLVNLYLTGFHRYF